METAKLVKALEGWRGDARLFELSKSVRFEDEGKERQTKYVIVSAANVIFSGPETYIFPASKDGKVLDWGELDGSYRGGLSHRQALKNAGYKMQ